MPTLYICRGLPASGKSTWARKLVQKNPGTKRVNRDDLRAMIDPEWDPKKEEYIEIVRNYAIGRALLDGHDCVCDDTNLKDSVFEQVKSLGTETGADVVVQDFTDVPIEICIARDQGRTIGHVGEKVIRDMAKRYLSKTNTKRTATTPAINPAIPDAIIVDVDGTLAVFDGIRGPFETEKAEQDLVNTPVALTVQKLRQGLREGTAFRIIICSGREDKFRSITEAWLRKHQIPFDHLYMRPSGDFRKDAIIKKEIYDQHIKGNFNVLFVLDDRDQVVKMWREELNLTVFQVSEGNF
jgi:predicted kinase